jgi:hypothetical protein
LGKILIKGLLPCASMDQCCLSDHAIQVKQEGPRNARRRW